MPVAVVVVVMLVVVVVVAIVVVMRVTMVIWVGAVLMVVGVRVVVVDPRGMGVRVGVDERAVVVLVGVHVGLVGMGVAKSRHFLTVSGGAAGSAGRRRHVASALMTPTAAQVRTIGMTPTR
jgi:hypothetical protein